MADSYKKLAQLQLTTTAATVAYTVPAGGQAIIRSIQIVNTTAATTSTIKAFDSGSADVNALLPNGLPWTLSAGEMLAWKDDPITMNAGGTLQFQAGTANVLTVTIYGDEVT